MQERLSEILDNLLGLLLLEGSYDIEEDESGFYVTIETSEAGKLIGFRGESLEALQLLVNQMLAKKIKEPTLSEPVVSVVEPVEVVEGFKRVVLDVSGWRKQKEEELAQRAKAWANQALESGQEVTLEPMSPWQRRVVHMVVGEIEGVSSESIGEGRDRHLVIRPVS